MGQKLLEGIRVLDLTMVYAGPIGTRILADMGAEVIKIESVQRIDMPTRRVSYPENEPGSDPWNRGGYFHRLNVNKKGLTLNLSDPKGADIFRRLVKISDVVTENYSPRVMRNFGLDYEALKEINPKIIMASMSGFGQTGPHRDDVTYVLGMESKAGLSALMGYVDGAPIASGTDYGDWMLGMYGVSAILLALYHRDRTGRGQYLDISGREALMCHLGEPMMDYTLNGRVATRMGNKESDMAPHDSYRCRGKDNWVAIAIGSDEEWQGFCEVLGNPAWTKEERFSTAQKRWRNQDDMREFIEKWTGQYDHYDVMHMLQRAGIAAGAALNVKEVMADPHLMQQGVFEVIEHKSRIGKRLHPKQMVSRYSDAEDFIPEPAPLLGEHNEYVLGELLGMSAGEMAQLEEEKVIGKMPARFPPGQEKPLPLDQLVKEGNAARDVDYLDVLSKACGTRLGFIE